MNQNSKSNLTAPTSSRLPQGKLIILATILTFCSSPIFAQNQFQASSSFQSSNNAQWTPPNSNPNPSQTTLQNSSDLAVSFPDSVTPFDGSARQADFESPVAETESNGSFESKIDGAAATLSKWKDIAGEKTSGLFDSMKQDGSWLKKAQTTFGSSDIGKMLGSLALVLGLYFAFVWVMRKLNPNGNAGLPSEVIEILGQVPFGNRKNLQLVRLGSKLLLLMNSAEGTQPIGEITDPAEVEYLASLCPGNRPRRHGRSNRTIQPSPSQVPAARLSSETSINSTVGPTNLNDVIRILQNANHHQGTVFEA